MMPVYSGQQMAPQTYPGQQAAYPMYPQQAAYPGPPQQAYHGAYGQPAYSNPRKYWTSDTKMYPEHQWI